jgi:hypothetical protein
MLCIPALLQLASASCFAITLEPAQEVYSKLFGELQLWVVWQTEVDRDSFGLPLSPIYTEHRGNLSRTNLEESNS